VSIEIEVVLNVMLACPIGIQRINRVVLRDGQDLWLSVCGSPG
jgi:hypothetical protein